MYPATSSHFVIYDVYDVCCNYFNCAVFSLTQIMDCSESAMKKGISRTVASILLLWCRIRTKTSHEYRGELICKEIMLFYVSTLITVTHIFYIISISLFTWLKIHSIVISNLNLKERRFLLELLPYIHMPNSIYELNWKFQPPWNCWVE